MFTRIFEWKCSHSKTGRDAEYELASRKPLREGGEVSERDSQGTCQLESLRGLLVISKCGERRVVSGNDEEGDLRVYDSGSGSESELDSPFTGGRDENLGYL